MKKMTKKDYYNQLLTIEAVNTNEDLVAFINKEIDAIDAKAEKAKERADAKKKEPDVLKDAVIAQLDAAGFKTVKDIVAGIDSEDATPAKVVARLTQLVKAGVVVKDEVKVDKTKAVAYKLA